jgi:DNA-binding NarL/FixJ family response regulator
MTIRVLLADDQEMVRSGLRAGAGGPQPQRLRNQAEIAAWAWETGLIDPAVSPRPR